MIAVIKTGGKQYLIQEGDVLEIEKLLGSAGDQVSFELLMKANGDKVEIGTPLLSGKVTGEIMAQGRAPKVSIVKYKAKSRYTRRVGHRQPFTRVKIKTIG